MKTPAQLIGHWVRYHTGYYLDGHPVGRVIAVDASGLTLDALPLIDSERGMPGNPFSVRPIPNPDAPTYRTKVPWEAIHGLELLDGPRLPIRATRLHYGRLRRAALDAPPAPPTMSLTGDEPDGDGDDTVTDDGAAGQPGADHPDTQSDDMDADYEASGCDRAGPREGESTSSTRPPSRHGEVDGGAPHPTLKTSTLGD